MEKDSVIFIDEMVFPNARVNWQAVRSVNNNNNCIGFSWGNEGTVIHATGKCCTLDEIGPDIHDQRIR